MEQPIEKNIRLILDTMKKVVTNPVGFFKGMPRSRGFIEPLVFMVSMGVAAGIIQAFFSIIIDDNRTIPFLHNFCFNKQKQAYKNDNNRYEYNRADDVNQCNHLN